MADQKISQLDIATSSLADDNLVIQRGFDNLSLAVGLISTGGGDTGSFVTTSSISGTTQTFTKGDGSTYTNEIVSASFAISASYAVSSSVEITKEVSSSYADTASYFNTGPISSSASTARDEVAAQVSGAFQDTSASFSTSQTNLSSSASTAREALASDIESLSGSASTARNAIASDLTSQSSSFASDRVMRAGDTMTGALTINTSSQALIVGKETDNTPTDVTILRHFLNSGSLKFGRTTTTHDVAIDVNGLEDLQLKINQATDYKSGDFRIIDDTNTVMEIIGANPDVTFAGKLRGVSDPVASQDVATKNYADNLVYTVPVMFSGNGSGSSGDYSAGSKVAFSVDVDTNSAWSNDTYTIPEDGVYEIITSLRTRIETDDRRSAIYKGTGHIRIIENPQGATGGTYRSRTGVGHIITSLVTGDTISVGAFQTTTNYPNVTENGLSIRKLRN